MVLYNTTTLDEAIAGWAIAWDWPELAVRMMLDGHGPNPVSDCLQDHGHPFGEQLAEAILAGFM